MPLPSMCMYNRLLSPVAAMRPFQPASRRAGRHFPRCTVAPLARGGTGLLYGMPLHPYCAKSRNVSCFSLIRGHGIASMAAALLEEPAAVQQPTVLPSIHLPVDPGLYQNFSGYDDTKRQLDDLKSTKAELKSLLDELQTLNVPEEGFNLLLEQAQAPVKSKAKRRSSAVSTSTSTQGTASPARTRRSRSSADATTTSSASRPRGSASAGQSPAGYYPSTSGADALVSSKAAARQPSLAVAASPKLKRKVKRVSTTTAAVAAAAPTPPPSPRPSAPVVVPQPSPPPQLQQPQLLQQQQQSPPPQQQLQPQLPQQQQPPQQQAVAAPEAYQPWPYVQQPYPGWHYPPQPYPPHPDQAPQPYPTHPDQPHAHQHQPQAWGWHPTYPPPYHPAPGTAPPSPYPPGTNPPAPYPPTPSYDPNYPPPPGYDPSYAPQAYAQHWPAMWYPPQPPAHWPPATPEQQQQQQAPPAPAVMPTTMPTSQLEIPTPVPIAAPEQLPEALAPAAARAVAAAPVAVAAPVEVAPVEAAQGGAQKKALKRMKLVKRTVKRPGAAAASGGKRKGEGSVAAVFTPGPGGSADGTGQFFKNISGSELLAADEEKALALQVQDYLKLEALEAELTEQLGHEPQLPELAKAAGMDPFAMNARLQRGKNAKRVMVDSNMRLVVSIAKQYQHKGLSLQELITEGITGLVRGVDKFDPSKGFKFSTYAHWWVRQAMTRAIAEQGRVVRLPTHLQDMMSKLRRLRGEFVQQHGRDPSNDELASSASLTVAKVEQLQELYKQVVSLDQPMGSDSDGGNIQESLASENAEDPFESAIHQAMRVDLEAVVNTLPEREAMVLKLRYGLGGHKEMTLEEVGRVFKVTRERIRQIEAKAIRHLRSPTRQTLLQEHGMALEDKGVEGVRRMRGLMKT